MTAFRLFSLGLSLSLLMPLACIAAEEKVELEVGDQAPKFEGNTTEDKLWKSEEHAGEKIYVVYFYPADLTPGCTRQACTYRDSMKEFQDKNVEVIGISGDTVENHKQFKSAHKLNFTLLADPEGKIAKAFGVETREGGSFSTNLGGQELTLDRGITAMRWTFVIDKDWEIAFLDKSVNPSKDAENVMAIVEKLQSGG